MFILLDSYRSLLPVGALVILCELDPAAYMNGRKSEERRRTAVDIENVHYVCRKIWDNFTDRSDKAASDVCLNTHRILLSY